KKNKLRKYRELKIPQTTKKISEWGGLAKHKRATSDPRIVYIQSHVRTRQWFKGGKVHVWSDGADNDQASYPLPKTLKKVNSI
ncbi:MAG: hypothetical protein D3908_05705, partial [Candidatus Electrothrix sp. AUS4]|nr:hypothetical protein [Candidatus Electrothrix sp. AUS4]